MAPKVAVVLTDVTQIREEDPRFLGTTERTREALEHRLRVELSALGYRPEVVGFDAAEACCARLRELAPKLVFNLTEEAFGERRHDASIVGMLELLRYRVTGAGPRGLMLGRDKAASKLVLRDAGIAVPDFCVLEPDGRRIGEVPSFPALVKPRFGDGSEGISLESIVRSPAAMRERAAFVHRNFAQAAICERYVAGRELLSFVVRNRRQLVLPAVEIGYGSQWNNPTPIATHRVKHDRRYRERVGMHYRDPELDEALVKRVEWTSKRAFHALEMRDYGRVDMLLQPGGELCVLEVNPNPCLVSKAVSLPRSGPGYCFGDLVGDIVKAALARYRRARG